MAEARVWRSASLPIGFQILEMVVGIALSLSSAARCGPGTPVGSCPWLLTLCLLLISLATRVPPVSWPFPGGTLRPSYTDARGPLRQAGCVFSTLAPSCLGKLKKKRGFQSSVHRWVGTSSCRGGLPVSGVCLKGQGPGGRAWESLDLFQLLLAMVQGELGHSVAIVWGWAGGGWPRGGVAAWSPSDEGPVLTPL